MRVKIPQKFWGWIGLRLQENGDRKNQPGSDLQKEQFWIFIPGNGRSFS